MNEELLNDTQEEAIVEQEVNIEELEKQKKEQDDRQRKLNFEEMKRNRTKELKQLEEWCELKCNKLLFDSNVDNWSKWTSVFNERIIGKKQLIFLIEDEDHELFGYYLNTKIKNNYNKKFYTQKRNSF